MPTEIIIHIKGDGIYPDLLPEKTIHLGNDAPPLQIAILEGGMIGGSPSVSIRADLPDGKIFFAEASLLNFMKAATIYGSMYPAIAAKAAQVVEKAIKDRLANPTNSDELVIR